MIAYTVIELPDATLCRGTTVPLPFAAVSTRTFVAAPAVSANEFDVAAVKLVGVKVNVKFPAVPVMTRLVNVATPLPFVATVVVPLSTQVPDAIVATTLTLAVLTLLLLAS